MARSFLFTDEAGCFAFNRNRNASKYFILCSISLDSCEIGNKLLELRRELAWKDFPLGDYFHASPDKQVVRDAVYNFIQDEDFIIDATIMEKSKAQPHVRNTNERFYKTGWYFHFKNTAPQIVSSNTELLITTASVGTKKGQAVFTSAVNDVIQQTIPNKVWATDFSRSSADPCLQITDYCTWAIQRKWESNHSDVRSYDLIKNKIRREFDLWSHGRNHYY